MRGVGIERQSIRKEWDSYIRGNVVSEAAAHLIRSMLTKTVASKMDGGSEGSQGDESDADDEIAPLVVKPEDLRRLLRSAYDDDENDEPASKKRRLPQKTNHRDSLHRVDCLWGTRTGVGGDDSAHLAEDGMHFDAVREHIAASRQKQEVDADDCPYSGKTLPAAQLYDGSKVSILDRWLEELQALPQAPTTEQTTFLRTVLSRMSFEAKVEGQGKASDHDDEPLFDMVHGVPGAGKANLLNGFAVGSNTFLVGHMVSSSYALHSRMLWRHILVGSQSTIGLAFQWQKSQACRQQEMHTSFRHAASRSASF